ncbi:MAG: hypothetical protein AAF212_10810, partial [Verrucomicrobiota bacterium]
MNPCPRTRVLLAIIFSSLSFTAILSHGAVQLPIRVFSIDQEIQSKTVSINLPSGANSAVWLYTQIHNVRYGGQVSVQVNGGDWIHIHNHTVEIYEPERSQRGIGGISSTLRLNIPLNTGDVVNGNNDITFRFNGTDGVVHGFRVLALNILDASLNHLVPNSEFSEEDPSSWDTNPDADEVALGKDLWNNASLQNDPISRIQLNATCASCHFEDGSDLKYFNYSNYSIISRGRFHGLSEQSAQAIASYIRSLDTPTPGRPWNPPYQPGPGLDPEPTDTPEQVQIKAESWMAGAGLDAVEPDETKIIEYIFPEGTSQTSISKVMDFEKTFSPRVIPTPIQFPDWNAWLPPLAPEDIWLEPEYYNVPYQEFNSLRNELENTPISTLTSQGRLNEIFDAFQNSIEDDWFEEFRLPLDGSSNPDFSADSAVSYARKEGLSREDMMRSLTRWVSIKIVELTRAYDLESEQDSVAAMQGKGHPEFTQELLSIPGGGRRSVVWAQAPHIIGNNRDHFQDQDPSVGKMESNQWYFLQFLLNSGFRMQVNMNAPLDWDYLLLHLDSASARMGRSLSTMRLSTQIKMLQARKTGLGPQQGGFSQRTLIPDRFYSNRDNLRRTNFMEGMEAIEPGLWNKIYEEFLYEWLSVMGSFDLDNFPRETAGIQHTLEPENTVPEPFVPEGRKSFFPRDSRINGVYRLIPLLHRDGVDEMLLNDFKDWANVAWPYNANSWGDTPSWDALFPIESLYYENFEDNSSDFSGLTLVSIKDGNYVNNDNAPTNGGGQYVARRGLNAGGNGTSSRSALNNTINTAVGENDRLKVNARLAFRDSDSVDPGEVSVEMRLKFDGGQTLVVGSAFTLDPDLYGNAFETFSQKIDVPSGATHITQLGLYWDRIGGTGGGSVYVDNVHIIGENTRCSTLTRRSSVPFYAGWRSSG